MSLYDLIDKLTSAIVSGYAKTANRHDYLRAQEKVRMFLQDNLGRLSLWAETHPGIRPPVYFNEQTGEVVWLNRTKARKLKRLMAREARASSATSTHTRRKSSSGKPPAAPRREADDEAAPEDSRSPE